MRDPPPTDAYPQPKESECKEEGIPTPKLDHEQYDVKEEPESPSMRQGAVLRPAE